MNANTIMDAIIKMGGNPLIVGGTVRDFILGINNKDIDIEVHGMSMDALIRVLDGFGRVDVVGRSFGVIKLTTDTDDFDFSLPRRDSKTSPGHKGFDVKVDPGLSPMEAARRRDFTWNAMARDKDGRLFDWFGGMDDLFRHIIRHTSDAFVDDPLRVLRGMQFSGRFNMRVAPETALLCKSMMDEFDTLSQERVWNEWWKWATKSTVPSAGMKFLIKTDWVELFPRLNAMRGVQQDEVWHPEGTVWVHTMHAVDVAAQIATRDGLTTDERGTLVLAALCHDMGKPATTTKKRGRIVSPGHAKTDDAMQFLAGIGAPKHIANDVNVLVREHMAHLNAITKRAVRRLLVRLDGTPVKLLASLIEADHSARPPLAGGLPKSTVELLQTANDVAGEIAPLVQGRHLIEMGMSPSPRFGDILRAAHAAQLDGKFNTVDGGIKWVKSDL